MKEAANVASEAHATLDLRDLSRGRATLAQENRGGRDILKRPRKDRKATAGSGGGFDDPGGGRHGERHRKSFLTRLVGPILILCAIVAVLFAGDYWMNQGKVYGGITVADVDIGGMNPDEARDAIRERTTGALDEIRLVRGSEEFSFPASEMGVDYDVDATVDAAYAIGREGGIFQRISNRFETAYGAVELEPRVTYDSARAEEQVREVASSTDQPERDATVRVVGAAVDTTGSEEGYEMNVQRTLDSVDAAVDDLSGEVEISGRVLEPEFTTAEAERAAARASAAMEEQLVLTNDGESWTVSPSAIGDSLDISTEGGGFRVTLDRAAMRENLAGVYDSLEQPAVEASYDVNGTDVSVAPGQQGRSIQSEELLGSIQQGIFQGRTDFQIPLVVQRPELTTAEAQAMKPTEMLGEYSTNYLTYDDTPGRVTNLKIGSGAVDGQLVAPGEVFSFNDLASQYDYESGSVIVGGKVDEADGGGLCQVSSTLYMAANYAGLDVVERHPHYAELPYIRPGFDATVWFGALDMKFENSTDGYILIKENVDTETGDVYAAIYGVPQDVQVDMSSKKVGESSDKKGQPITDWVTYQSVTRDGQVEYDGVLHEDRYEYLQPADS